jgi:hypothetical protein
MGGGLMQLVAYGSQDIYLTGNPQVTFFKTVYRRHTNFSMESIRQTWAGTTITNGKCSATISRNGDLISKIYLEIDGCPKAHRCNPGSSFIDTVEIEIGGQLIDKQTGHWLEIWSELTRPNSSGIVPNFGDAHTFDGTFDQRVTGQGGIFKNSTPVSSGNSSKFFIPLQFWFCRNPGLSLPLIALQYHEVKIILKHFISDVFGHTIKNDLWCDYIYLDTDERRRFAQISHEYLIEQIQENTFASGETSQVLTFNHPVKEIICSKKSNFVQNSGSALTNTQLTGTANKLLLNGHDRFVARDRRYFTRFQIREYHSGPGGLDVRGAPSGGNMIDTIWVYSFALKPEEHQPSGTCNFSRIDNAELVGFEANEQDTIHAVNYNVLRIMSGMGGLAYSN